MEEINAWIARDENNGLWVFTVPPYKFLGQWECDDDSRAMSINSKLFPEVQWSDEEPTKVKLVIDK